VENRLEWFGLCYCTDQYKKIVIKESYELIRPVENSYFVGKKKFGRGG
jgi:hypothetical protein